MQDERLLLPEVPGSGWTQPGSPHPSGPHLNFHISHSSPLPFPSSAIPSAFCCPRPHHSKKWTKACSVVLPTPSSWQTWDLGEPGTKESSFLMNTQALVPTANPTPGQGTGPGDPSNFIENQTKRDTKENWFRGKRFSTFAACFPFVWAFPPIFTLWATIEMLAHLTLKCFPAVILKAISKHISRFLAATGIGQAQNVIFKPVLKWKELQRWSYQPLPFKYIQNLLSTPKEDKTFWSLSDRWGDQGSCFQRQSCNLTTCRPAGPLSPGAWVGVKKLQEVGLVMWSLLERNLQVTIISTV